MSDNPPESLLLSAVEAAALCGVKKSLWWSSGRLGPLPVKLGRRTLWRKDELSAWVQAGCPARDKWQKMKAEESEPFLRRKRDVV